MSAVRQTERENGVRRLRMLAGLAVSVVALIGLAVFAYGSTVGWGSIGWLVEALVFFAFAGVPVAVFAVLTARLLWETVTEPSPSIGWCLALTGLVTFALCWVVACVAIAVLVAAPESVYVIGGEWTALPMVLGAFGGFIGIMAVQDA